MEGLEMFEISKKFERLEEKSINMKHIKLHILLRNSNIHRKIHKHTKATLKKEIFPHIRCF